MLWIACVGITHLREHNTAGRHPTAYEGRKTARTFDPGV